MQISEKMARTELRATLGLASIYSLRMLGVFLILPIFAIYAEQLTGSTHTLIGLAMGIYSLMQVILQVPFGVASDKYGRKTVIYIGLLLYAVGSVIAALSSDIYMMILGRAIQGTGAISAVITALVADCTREEHRTQAMAMIGATIGLTFAVSLVAGPMLNEIIGVSGIFWMTAILSALAILWVKYAIPNPPSLVFHSDAQTAPSKIKDVLKDVQLLRLNFGTFCLHGSLMVMFMVVPFALKQTSGLSENVHWKIYLPVLFFSFIAMIPAIIYAEKKAKLKPIFIGAVALLLVAQIAFAINIDSFKGIVVAMFIYFIAFNTLEASLPSLISKMAPTQAKGTALGIHSTAQALGMFLGAFLGGALSQHMGAYSVFICCALIVSLWLVFTLSMQTPPRVKTKMYHIENIASAQALQLAETVQAMEGVIEAVAIANEQVLIVKTNQQLPEDKQITLHEAILVSIGSK